MDAGEARALTKTTTHAGTVPSLPPGYGYSAQGLGETIKPGRPLLMANEQALAVLPELEPILPGRGLPRGFILVVQGPAAPSLALALSAGASKAGSWVAAAGMTALGTASAAELGVVPEHLVLVYPPPPRLWPTVIATLIDAFDIVLVDWPGISATMTRRLSHRTRDRRAVLIPVVSGNKNHFWNEAADVRLVIRTARWHGLEWGHGRLSSRRIEVETGGRRSPMPYRTALWLPDPEGKVSAENHSVRPVPCEEQTLRTG